MLAARGLTGCDTVATYHGIGKSMALKVLRSETLPLSKVGEITLSVEDVLVQSTPFVVYFLYCYGHPQCSSLTDARHKMRLRKVLRNIGAALSVRVSYLQIKLSWKT